MKCFCCGNEMKMAATIWCPDCGITLDMKTKRAVVLARDTASYVSDSYACMEAINKFKPDIVTAKQQLFHRGFKLNEVKFFYKNKAAKVGYDIPDTLINPSNIIHTNYEKYVEADDVLIAINGALSYAFKRMLLVNCILLGKWTGLPVMSLFNIKPTRYLWQLSGNLSLKLEENIDDVREFVDVVTRYRLGLHTSSNNDELALIAYSTNRVASFLSGYPINPDTLCAAVDILKERVKEALISVDKNVWETSKNDKLLDSVCEVYAETRPCLGQPKGMLFDPMVNNYIDTGYTPALNSSMSTTLKWWKFLSALFGKYQYPGEVTTVSALRSSYEEWANS